MGASGWQSGTASILRCLPICAATRWPSNRGRSESPGRISWIGIRCRSFRTTRPTRRDSTMPMPPRSRVPPDRTGSCVRTSYVALAHRRCRQPLSGLGPAGSGAGDPLQLRSAAYERRWQVLGRTSNRCSSPQLIRSVDASPGTTVPVPEPGRNEVVFVRIYGAGVSGLERLSTFLLHARTRRVVVNGAQSYRLIPGTASDGLLLWGGDRIAAAALSHRFPRPGPSR